MVEPIGLSLAVQASATAVIFYLSLDFALGVAMAVLLSMCACVGSYVAASTTSVWLSAGIGAFVIGWAIQFTEHVFEGRKPAFLDDMNGLIIGPLFVVAEVAFFLGFRKRLKEKMDETMT